MQDALNLLLPTKEERKKIKIIHEEFSDNIRIKDTKVELGGSVAKDTWLRGEHDIDIYVKFDPKTYSKKNISSILKKALDKKYQTEKIHGSRDYYRTESHGYIIELIPILNITKAPKAENITDVSPFHVKYVKKHKDKTDEIRLVKSFCKANNLYGAESYIKGFSGYVLEILTIHYGTFKKLLRAASKWDKTTVLDPAGHYKYKNVMFSLNRSKLVSPLVLVDPVQAERNAAAGVGEDKYSKLIRLAGEYTKKPSLSYFKKKKADKEKLKKRHLILEAEAPAGKRDVAGAKLLKAFEFFARELQEHDFEIQEKDWHWEPGQKALMWFKLKEENLPKKKKHIGPPLKLEVAVKRFRDSWKHHRVQTDKDRCYVLAERAHPDARQLLQTLIKSKYLKGKAKKPKLL